MPSDLVSEDVHGKIWRITYSGPMDAELQGAPAPIAPIAKAEGIDAASLPLAPGATREQLRRGSRIFLGQVAGATCSGCHGSDGKGSTVGPNLTTGQWSWSDGSWQSISATIDKGVATPKHADGAMPPRGGAPLTDADVKAVAAFVWGISHQNPHGGQHSQ